MQHQPVEQTNEPPSPHNQPLSAPRASAEVYRLSDHLRTSDQHPHSAEAVWAILRARQARPRFFSPELFAEPAWDILLELYALGIEQRRASVSKLGVSSRVPLTTMLRWLEKLSADSLVTRREDPLDRRRIWVELTYKGTAAMRSYFNEAAGGFASC